MNRMNELIEGIDGEMMKIIRSDWSNGGKRVVSWGLINRTKRVPSLYLGSLNERSWYLNRYLGSYLGTYYDMI